MNASPIGVKTDLVSIEVDLDGEAMPNTYVLESINVTREVNRMGTARIVLTDGDPSRGKFSLSEEGRVVPGVLVQIRMGYHQHTQVVFKGVIVKHGVRVSQKGQSRFVLTCTDRAVSLTAGRRSAVYRARSESDIWKGVLEAQGLTLAVGAADEARDIEQAALSEAGEAAALPADLVRHDSSDWDFMLTRAEAAGQVVVVDDARLTIAQPALSGNGCGLRLTYGESIIALSADMDARDQLNRKTFGLIGKVSFQGNALAVPGKTIELAGLGGRFDGDVYIARVEHTIDDGNWVTEVGFGMSPRWFAENNPDLRAPPA